MLIGINNNLINFNIIIELYKEYLNDNVIGV